MARTHIFRFKDSFGFSLQMVLFFKLIQQEGKTKAQTGGKAPQVSSQETVAVLEPLSFCDLCLKEL